MSPIIVVLGATGLQGGAVVKALLKYGKYSVRAVTRSLDTDRAKELAKICPDIVTANCDDVESLKAAFQGAYGAYFVTNYWEHIGDVDREMQQTRNLADAAAACGLKHVVLSSLEDSRKVVREGSMPKYYGDYTVPEYDGKGEVQPYVCEKVPTTVLLACGYYDNFVTYAGLLGPKPKGDGTFSLMYPLGQVATPLVATADIGKLAAKFLEDPSYIGKTIAAVGEFVSMADAAKLLSERFGKTVVYDEMTVEDFAKIDTPFAVDLSTIFQYWRDYAPEYNKIRDLALVKSIIPDVYSLKDWVEENRDSFFKILGIESK